MTIALWIKLDKNLGEQSVFDTAGGTASTHRDGQYHLEVINGRVRWFHRNERHVTIFSVLTKPLLKTGYWTHLAVTYDGVIGIAKVGWIKQLFFLSLFTAWKFPYSEFFWSVFSRIWTEYEKILSIFPYSFECWKIQTWKTPNTETFYAVIAFNSNSYICETLVQYQNSSWWLF